MKLFVQRAWWVVLACACLGGAMAFGAGDASAAPTAPTARGWLGVRSEATPTGGLHVVEVVSGSPADRAGVRLDDVLLAVDGVALQDHIDLATRIARAGEGTTVTLRVRSAGAPDRDLPARLERLRSPEEQSRARLVGQPAPVVAADRISGSDPVQLPQLRGRVVVLDFWATWCRPCRAIMPALDQMHRQLHDRGLTVLGVSNESPARIRDHLRGAPVSYTVARDSGGTASRFGVQALPTLVVLDRAGHVREVFVGMDSASLARLENLVPRLLAEP